MGSREGVLRGFPWRGPLQESCGGVPLGGPTVGPIEGPLEGVP
jgi:hypothetical protein